MKKVLLLLSILILSCTVGYSQVTINKEVGKKNEAIKDSLKNTDYPYILPIWGDKVTKKGFSLPYSAGVSVNYFWQQSDLVIDNLMVGFNNGTMYNIDGVVRFDKAVATAAAVTVRPDVWVLPFLNVYGIFGGGKGSTTVGYGIWAPDSTNVEKEIFSSETKVDFNMQSAGFGLTPTMGIGTGWMALDMNFTWSDLTQLDKPAFVFVFGPRLGKTFRFKTPERNIATWIGGFRVHMNSGTSGSISLAEAFPAQVEFDQKVLAAEAKVDNAQTQVETWWTGLTPAEQKNPVNVAKYNKSNEVLTKTGEFINGVETAYGNVSTSTVQYSLDKRPKNAWNFLIGSQFQYNKHIMIRAEYGFLASRIQFMAGLQYRFGL